MLLRSLFFLEGEGEAGGSTVTQRNGSNLIALIPEENNLPVIKYLETKKSSPKIVRSNNAEHRLQQSQRPMVTDVWGDIIIISIGFV